MKTELFYVGFDGERVVSSTETLRQIDVVEKLECALQHQGQPLSWLAFANPEEPRTIFRTIVRDRERRVDQNTLMADRPMAAIITAVDGRAVRLEFYEGHDELELVYDVRAAELKGQNLPNWLTSDPYAYDPSSFLEEVFGLDPKVTKPWLQVLHRALDEEEK